MHEDIVVSDKINHPNIFPTVMYDSKRLKLKVALFSAEQPEDRLKLGVECFV